MRTKPETSQTEKEQKISSDCSLNFEIWKYRLVFPDPQLEPEYFTSKVKALQRWVEVFYEDSNVHSTRYKQIKLEEFRNAIGWVAFDENNSKENGKRKSRKASPEAEALF